MSDIPAGYGLQTVFAMELEPGDIIRGEGGGIVAGRPTEDPDPFNRTKPYALVHFEGGSDARYLPE